MRKLSNTELDKLRLGVARFCVARMGKCFQSNESGLVCSVYPPYGIGQAGGCTRILNHNFKSVVLFCHQEHPSAKHTLNRTT